MSAPPPVLSFVLPAFNESASLEPLRDRLIEVAERLGEPFEIVWVNDGSTDGTEALLDSMAATDPRIRPLHFSRNFGHMAALTAGFEHARATGAVISLDSDGQHPPELIPQMVERWRRGADIVQAVREGAAGSFAKRWTSRLFYPVMNLLTELEIPGGAADFRLLDRQAVDALNGLPERERFIRGLIHWVGFRREQIPCREEARIAGKTKYGIGRMIAFALGGITSFSVRPLRLSFLLGLLVILAAAVYAVYILWCYVRGIPLVPGWTSMLLVVLTLSGVQLLTLGIASEFVARLYVEQKQRPIYILRKKRPDVER